MTNVMHKFLIYLFSSALHVSGLLLAHLRSQVYNCGSGSKSAGYVVSARALTTYPADFEPPKCTVLNNIKAMQSLGMLVGENITLSQLRDFRLQTRRK